MDAVQHLNSTLEGRYEVEREIGAGGMATVYLARDLKHSRRVAIKVLNPDLGAVLGGERFLAEIRVTANLQHPNLLPLFDSGVADGLLYYVMPFIEGESLRARLEREKQLPVDEAIRMATAVAGSLDYAHRHGVIHRDLKPENILLHEGQPMVADFGIALAVSNAGGNRITQTGLSLGTPQYMSPEQATGDRAIDGRTDIYSLAAVLYEMLTGEPPHTGSTAQAIIARLLTDKPRAVRASRDTVPEHVDWAIERALAKLPADRWATAQEFSDAIAGARLPGPPTGVSTAATNATARSGAATRIVRLAPWIVAAAATAAGLFAWQRGGAAPVQRARFTIMLGDSARLRSDVAGVLLDLSPDGSRMVYVGGSAGERLYMRSLDDLTPHALPGTENPLYPHFSPDGKWVTFIVQNVLKKIPAVGGPVTTITDSVARYSWGEGGVIVFGRTGSGSGPLYRVGAAGGPAQPVTTLDSVHGESGHTWPFMLPGGTAFLFTIQKGGSETSEIAAARLDGGPVIHLGLHGTNPRYVSSGQVVFGRLDGSLAAAAFDARALRVMGPEVTVLDNIHVKGGGATEVSISGNGTLAYVQGRPGTQLVVLDRQGHARPIRAETKLYSTPRFSPDGRRLILSIGLPGGSDIWICDVATGALTRLTNDGKSDRPVWSADGKRVAWRWLGPKAEIRWQAADGSGAPEMLIPDAVGAAFSSDGKSAIAQFAGGGRADLIALDSTRRRTTIVPSGNNYKPSPDGRWVAYQIGGEIYVRAISGSGGLHQISIEGGMEPVWGANGRELFYRNKGWLLSATIETTPAFNVIRRDSLFEDNHLLGFGLTDYDVSPDGKQFVMLKPSQIQDPPVIVLGWLDELRERMTLVGKK